MFPSAGVCPRALLALLVAVLASTQPSLKPQSGSLPSATHLFTHLFTTHLLSPSFTNSCAHVHSFSHAFPSSLACRICLRYAGKVQPEVGWQGHTPSARLFQIHLSASIAPVSALLCLMLFSPFQRQLSHTSGPASPFRTLTRLLMYTESEEFCHSPSPLLGEPIHYLPPLVFSEDVAGG